MNKIYLSLIVSLFGLVGLVSAADAPMYPISELGNCENKETCMSYCNKAENMDACIAYGEKNNMMTAEEARLSKVISNRLKNDKMPGGCKDKDSCTKFCQGNISNLEECLTFAEEVGLTNSNIEEGKKIYKALKEGANLPGNCKDKNDCENYCADPNNLDECIAFGEKSGIISAEELIEAKKVAKFIKSGETPGSCKRKAECDTYCQKEENFTECLTFAEKAGFVSKEEAEMAKKTGGKGPGGCKSEAECKTYCEDQTHLDECAEFGVKTGLISEDEVKKMKEGAQMIKSGLEQIPGDAKPEAEACLNNVFGGKLQDVLDGKVTITKEQGDKVGPCIENAVQKFVKSQMESQMPQGGTGAPENIQMPQGIPENIQIPEGVQIPSGSTQQGPPCSSPEECMRMFGPKQ